MPYKKSRHSSLRIRNAVSEDRIWIRPELSAGEVHKRHYQKHHSHSAHDIDEFINERAYNDTVDFGRSSSVISNLSTAISSKGLGRLFSGSNSKTNLTKRDKSPRRSTVPVPSGENLEWSGDRMHRKLAYFDIEWWWSRSDMKTRVNAMFIALLFAIMLMYLITALFYMHTHFAQKIRSPYLCHTPSCHQAGQWMTSSMNTEIDPCENFYEFMCGRYHNESGGKEGKWFSEMINKPAFKIEFGADSMLAKLLKNFNHNDSYDQPIRFYQACLNHTARREYGFKAFIDKVEQIFGTRDFNNFEATTLSMEQIGANMLAQIGDGSYINFAFFTYPYITILRPSIKLLAVFPSLTLPSETPYSKMLARRVFENLLPKLQVSDPSKIEDAVQGLYTMCTIVRTALIFRSVSMNKSLTAPLPQEFMDLYTENFVQTKLCPPMGIQLDIRKVFEIFLQESDYRFHFFDLMALKYFRLFELCFAEPPTNFNGTGIKHPKTAFVSTWMFSLFWNFFLSMDTDNLQINWKLNETELKNSNWLLQNKLDQVDQHPELRCLLSLCFSLGHLPSIRYLLALNSTKTLNERVEDVRELIQNNFINTVTLFADLPETEIDKNMRKLGFLVFNRRLYVDVIQPLVNGGIQDQYSNDFLELGKDHLNNSLIGIKYLVEKARHNWLGSTNHEPNIKWWGYGEPNRIQNELFDIRDAFTLAAEFVETKHAATNNGSWETFLGRKYSNYILYPITVFDEPFMYDTYFFYFSGHIQELTRTVYSLLEDPFENRYAFLRAGYNKSEDECMELAPENWPLLIDYGNPVQTNSRKCSLLYNVNKFYTDPNKDYDYTLNDSLTTGDYTWNYHENFLSMLSLKQTYNVFRYHRRALSKQPFDWTTSQTQRDYRMQVLIADRILEKYTEEQLFFMSYVRHNCRGSWKTHKDGKEERYHLEITILSLLMQMEEFSQAFKCKKTSFMSNKDEPRCVQYMPDMSKFDLKF